MNIDMERLLLETVLRQGSLMPMLRSGYTYSVVMEAYYELADAKLVYRDENGIDQLTEFGRDKLKELRKENKTKYKVIQPLIQERITKMNPEDIYLP